MGFHALRPLISRTPPSADCIRLPLFLPASVEHRHEAIGIPIVGLQHAPWKDVERGHLERRAGVSAGQLLRPKKKVSVNHHARALLSIGDRHIYQLQLNFSILLGFAPLYGAVVLIQRLLRKPTNVYSSFRNCFPSTMAKLFRKCKSATFQIGGDTYTIGKNSRQNVSLFHKLLALAVQCCTRLSPAADAGPRQSAPRSIYVKVYQ